MSTPLSGREIRRKPEPGPDQAYNVNASGHGPASKAPLSAQDLSSKKRIRARTACEPCRNSRAACSGERPTCERCSRTGQKCVFETQSMQESRISALRRDKQELEAHNEKLNDLLQDALQCASALDRARLLERLRSLDMASSSSIQAHASPATSSRGTSAQAHESFGLSASRPSSTSSISVCYPKINDTDISLLEKLQGPQMTSEPLVTETSRRNSVVKTSSAAVKPESCLGSKLMNVPIRQWTQVSVDERYVSEMLTLYFEELHTVTSYFDHNLFLRDLHMNEPGIFCSSLLFNSILAFASLSYVGVQADASALSQLFLDEAQRQIKVPLTAHPSTAVAAFNILALLHMVRGDMRTGLHLIDQATVALLPMEGVSAGHASKVGGTINLTSTMNTDAEIAVSHAIWGSFNLYAMLYNFNIVPTPPKSSRQTVPYLAYEQLSRDGACKCSFCDVTYNTFWATCQFLKTFMGVLERRSSSKTNQEDEAQQSYEAQMRCSELREWADALVPSIHRRKDSPSCVITFHILLHLIVLDIIRPHLPKEDRHSLIGEGPGADTPQAIFTSSLKQLRYLVYDFLTHYTGATSSLWWHLGILAVANALILEGRNPTSMAYFRLCIATYQQLSRCYRVFELNIKGLIALALEARTLSPSEARQFLQSTSDEFDDAAMLKSGTYRLNTTLCRDQKPDQAGQLAKALSDILVFHECVNIDFYMGDE